jgi:hypothetical protein
MKSGRYRPLYRDFPLAPTTGSLRAHDTTSDTGPIVAPISGHSCSAQAIRIKTLTDQIISAHRILPGTSIPNSTGRVCPVAAAGKLRAANDGNDTSLAPRLELIFDNVSSEK